MKKEGKNEYPRKNARGNKRLMTFARACATQDDGGTRGVMASKSIRNYMFLIITMS